jgi:hypothetical protein
MDWVKAVGLTESALTSAAILAAGLWAYFHYLRGRPFSERIELNVQGRLLKWRAGVFLFVSMQVRNTGSARIRVLQEGTGLRISLSDPKELESDETFKILEWGHLATLPILIHHQWIEPNELVVDHQVISLKDNSLGCTVLLELYVHSSRSLWRSASAVTRLTN